ncbi:hypothetical protein BY996DRAFT_6583651 [Phakopsora pachyrhizi]|nr:hypothetical protein BY996DRAFT_6583651 [Phakopsora pachyrhizi]
MDHQLLCLTKNDNINDICFNTADLELSRDMITPITTTMAIIRTVTVLGGNGKDRGLRMIKNKEPQLNFKEELMEWSEEHQMKIVSNMAGKEEYHCGENKDSNYD